MTKDQALDRLAWGIVGIAAGRFLVPAIRHINWRVALPVLGFAVFVWAFVRLLPKADR